MDIKTTATITKPTETSSQVSSSSNTVSKDNTTTFKSELEAAKTHDQQDAQNAQDTEKNKNAEQMNNQINKDVQNIQKNVNEKTKTEKDENSKTSNNKEIANPLIELNSQIAVLNDIKSGVNSKTKSFNLKVEDKTLDKNDCFKTLKMDNNDVKFFLNLVENQQMAAQNAQLNNSNNTNNIINSFNEVKTQAAQETVKVSVALMDAINESAKTNKPFRIDFGDDIAVIMKVNKDGNLSANFIPGSTAVENYLRNNIEGLKQSFNEQNLPYDVLSYSKNQNQNQKQNKDQNNNKENENE